MTKLYGIRLGHQNTILKIIMALLITFRLDYSLWKTTIHNFGKESCPKNNATLGHTISDRSLQQVIWRTSFINSSLGEFRSSLDKSPQEIGPFYTLYFIAEFSPSKHFISTGCTPIKERPVTSGGAAQITFSSSLIPGFIKLHIRTQHREVLHTTGLPYHATLVSGKWYRSGSDVRALW